MRTTNWPLWLAVIFALNFGPGIARAGDISPRCPYPVSTAISALMKNVPDAVVFEFRGRNALLAIRIYNALPPTAHEGGDRFYIAMRPDFPLSRLIIARHGCVATTMLVDARIAVAIKKAIKRGVVTSAAL